MSIRIHHIENAPPALLDYVFYGSLIVVVVASVIAFHFDRKSRADRKTSNRRLNGHKRSGKWIGSPGRPEKDKP